MKGYFYSAPDAETLAAAAPSRFVADPDTGDLSPSGVTLRSTNGVWLSSPVPSEPDENGEQTVVEAGVRSDDDVIVSAEPSAALSSFRIEPEGETLA